MKKYWKYCLLCGILCIAMIFVEYKIYEEHVQMQEELASGVLRLHIRADSDEKEAQMLKLKVRDAIIAQLETYKDEMTDVQTSADVIRMHMEDIKNAACAEALKSGQNESVDVSLGQTWFPEKSYGDVILPEGDYTALIVKIGSGQGKNWWCVLFPQLCFINPGQGYVPEEGKDALKAQLSESTYEGIIDQRVEAKFRVVEWIQKLYE